MMERRMSKRIERKMSTTGDCKQLQVINGNSTSINDDRKLSTMNNSITDFISQIEGGAINTTKRRYQSIHLSIYVVLHLTTPLIYNTKEKAVSFKIIQGIAMEGTLLMRTFQEEHQ
jgi:hypothetical protein